MPPMPRMLAWFGITVAAAWLVLVGGGWLGIYTSALRLITVATATVILLGWAAVAWRRPDWRPRSVLMPAILACLASFSISTVFSRVPRVSLEYLGYAIVLAALYLLLVRLLANPFFRSRLVGIGEVFFVFIAIEFAVLIVWLWIGWWQDLGRLAIPPLRPHFIGLTYGNPSAVLTIVTLFAIPAAARWSSWRTRGLLAFVGIVGVVGVVALLSGSRAGWLALAITGLVAILALVANPRRRSLAWSLLAGRTHGAHRTAWRIAIPAVGLGLVAAAIVLLPAIVSRIDAGGEDLRTSFAIVAFRLFGQSPIVGTGPGTWTIERIANTHPDEIDYYIPHAHDVPAQTLAELGLVGAIAGVVLIASIVLLLRSAARSPDDERRRWAWFTGLGLLYFGLHQILDFYPNMPAVLFAAALPVAYLDATAHVAVRERRVDTRFVPPAFVYRLAPPLGLALVALACAGLLLQEIPAMELNEAVTAADSGDWRAALGPARAAASADPDIEPYQLTAGLASDHAGDHQQAAAYFQAVADRDDLPEAWLNLAAEQAILRRTPDAIASLARADRLGAERVEVLMPLGDLALRLGDVAGATEAFARAMVIQPSLAADPWWHSDPARVAILPAVLANAESTLAPAARWQLALMTGDVSTAHELGDVLPSVRDEIDAWSGDRDALGRLNDTCAAAPVALGTLAWCARAEAHLGNSLAAGDYRMQMDVVAAGSSVGAHELRVNTEPVLGPTIPQSAAWFWGIYTYRRAIPNDMLVPSLVHLIAT